MNTDGNLDALSRHLHEIEEYEARMITCPECDGLGRAEYEVGRPHAGGFNCGFLEDEWRTCQTCDGAGDVEVDDEEE